MLVAILMKMISYITKIIKKSVGLDFSNTYSSKALFEFKGKLYLLAVRKSTNASYYIPLIDGHFRLSKKLPISFYNENNELEDLNNCHDFRINLHQKLVTYKKRVGQKENLYISKLNSNNHWKTNIIHENEKGIAVTLKTEFNNKKSLLAFLSRENLQIAEVEKDGLIIYKKTLADLKDHKIIGVNEFDEGLLASFVKITKKSKDWHISIVGILFDKKNPWHILWKSEENITEEIIPTASKSHRPEALGINYEGDHIYVYISISGSDLLRIKFLYPFSKQRRIAHHSTKSHIKLTRSDKNPILSPDPSSPWESIATFNPGAFEHNGIIHFLYRAIGKDDVSVLGYFNSLDGININYKHPDPAYFTIKPRELEIRDKDIPPAIYASGGGTSGGVEDPRVVKIGNKVYLVYIAFDGWSSVRIRLSSISLKDFLAKKWNWSKPVFISPKGEVHKNWVIFPEKINGKFAIIHGIHPQIYIDYIDDLDMFDGNNFIKSPIPQGGPQGGRKNFWDNKMRGPGSPPVKTKYGWLLLYHAMDMKDPNRYKIGAMILDLKDPTKVIYRSNQPILEPDAHYENHGHKAGVVYCCASVVKDDTFFVYYGGADKFTCVATFNIDDFVKKIKENKPFNNELKIIEIK